MAGYYVYKNNNILLTRGDTFVFNLYIEDDDLITETDTEYYSLQDDDVLYFHVYTFNGNEPILTFEFDEDDMEEPEGGAPYLPITIEHDDTDDLLPGTYFYEIKLHRVRKASGSVTAIDKWVTLIQRTKLTLVR